MPKDNLHLNSELIGPDKVSDFVPMPERKKVSLLITDVDNTLYDWLGIWSVAFEEMIRTLIDLTGVDRATLESDIRSVHTAQGSSECTIHVEELTCINQRSWPVQVRGRLADALESYIAFHNVNLTAYPSVLSTLHSINRSGATVVAYTEALGRYSASRIQKLGLDGELRYLYVPCPAGQNSSTLHKPASRVDRGALAVTVQRETRVGLKKPNPAVLQQILDELGVKAENAVYVGDSLLKDVKMAQEAQLTDVYAKYGTNRNSQQYELLRRVSHWSDRDVDRERRIDNSKDVIPTYSIQVFSQLLLLFDFMPTEL